MVFSFKRNDTEAQKIRNKLVIVEALIFALPFCILLYILYQINYRFEILHILLFDLTIVLILAGLLILRQIFDRIAVIAMSLKKIESGDPVTMDINNDVQELTDISVSVNNLIQKHRRTTEELDQRSFELLTIKELTELVKINLNIDDLMNLFLERSMTVVGAQIGSVFMVEQETRQKFLVSAKAPHTDDSELYRFRVVAAKGHDEELKKGSYIDSPVVKTVLLKRTPLLIQDIEKDPRTLKPNDPRYGSPSFLSMPIFIGDAVSAVQNLASKKSQQPFNNNDEQVLSIMFRDMSFAFDNAMLHAKVGELLQKIKEHNLELEKEIEGRKRTEMALIESEEKYRMLVENSQDMIYSINHTGHFIYANPVAERVTGFPRAELIGMQYLSLVRSDFHEEIDALYKKQFYEKIPNTYFEYPIIARDGSIKWIGQNVQLLKERGVVIGFQAVARDITEQKQREEALRKSEDKYRAVTERMSDVVWTIDLNLQPTYVSPSITKILGFSPEEWLKRNVSEMMTPESYQKFREAFKLEMQRSSEGSADLDTTITLESEYYHKNGSTVWLEDAVNAILDPNGNIIGFQCSSRDITKRKQGMHLSLPLPK